MNQASGGLPASRSEFLELVEGIEHTEILRDESRLRRIVLDAMKASDDPVTREIGEGLIGGTMSWSRIATTSAYSDFLDHSLTALRRFDFTRLAEELETAEGPAASEHHRDDDDGEDLWKGLRRRRR